MFFSKAKLSNIRQNLNPEEQSRPTKTIKYSVLLAIAILTACVSHNKTKYWQQLGKSNVLVDEQFKQCQETAIASVGSKPRINALIAENYKWFDRRSRTGNDRLEVLVNHAWYNALNAHIFKCMQQNGYSNTQSDVNLNEIDRDRIAKDKKLLTIIDISALKAYIEEYKPHIGPKSFVQSLDGSWAWGHGENNELSNKKALQKCQQNSMAARFFYPCVVINNNDSWISLRR